MARSPCHECQLSADCALDHCTLLEREHALTATRQVRDEQRRLLASLTAAVERDRQLTGAFPGGRAL